MSQHLHQCSLSSSHATSLYVDNFLIDLFPFHLHNSSCLLTLPSTTTLATSSLVYPPPTIRIHAFRHHTDLPSVSIWSSPKNGCGRMLPSLLSTPPTFKWVLNLPSPTLESEAPSLALSQLPILFSGSPQLPNYLTSTNSVVTRRSQLEPACEREREGEARTQPFLDLEIRNPILTTRPPPYLI